MIFSTWSMQSLMDAGLSRVLGNVPETSSPDTARSAIAFSAKPTELTLSDQIGLASLTGQVATDPASLTQSTQAAARPVYRITRDDAPSTPLVLTCLVGFVLLSLYLGYKSLPSHWSNKSDLTWRERSGW